MVNTDAELDLGDIERFASPPLRFTAVRFRVKIDGQAPATAHGGDVDGAGNGTADEQRLYQLIRQPMPIVDRLFEIEFLDAGWRPSRLRSVDWRDAIGNTISSDEYALRFA
jgi:hypothetical protein